MAEYTNTNVLHHLNKPMRILIWSPGECLSFLGLFALGVIFMDYIWVALLLMYGVGWGSKKFKSKFGETGGLVQQLYWRFPNRKNPKSNVKEYLS